ncbi:class D beta-lactamase [Paraburkholderia sp.]|uniref:class D beta-lactamase n=1 Tax=Paraburkholderia sp. TaxID=1926495 RepID=UPI0025DAA37F|nr:class D beta-lactamase [Paraburkholderia sp.]
MPKFRLLALAAAMVSASASVHARTVCTVVADAASERIVLQQGDCATRTTPASTFKIAISLMGFDSGYLNDAHTPTLQFHAGYPDWGGKAWEQPTDPSRWIQYSVVWYSQQVTRSLGMTRFANYTRAFGYGNADVRGDSRHDGLTHAWIDSSLQISPLEQVGFLSKVVNRRLPVSAHAFAMTSQITEVATLSDGWDIHGKTGTGFPQNADGSDDEAHGWGWFVGWASRNGKTLVFARLMQDDGARAEKKSIGMRARDTFLADFPGSIATLAPNGE